MDGNRAQIFLMEVQPDYEWWSTMSFSCFPKQPTWLPYTGASMNHKAPNWDYWIPTEGVKRVWEGKRTFVHFHVMPSSLITSIAEHLTHDSAKKKWSLSKTCQMKGWVNSHLILVTFPSNILHMGKLRPIKALDILPVVKLFKVERTKNRSRFSDSLEPAILEDPVLVPDSAGLSCYCWCNPG